MTVKQIIKEINLDNFGISYKQEGKTVKINSFWGSYDTYHYFTKKLRREGYTVFE